MVSRQTDTSPSTHVYLGLGSNVGDRLENLARAVGALVEHGIDLISCSSVFESQAHLLPGAASQPDFLNAVVAATTDLSPEELLDTISAIERDLGRDRTTSRPWTPRSIDIDVLIFNTHSFTSDRLTIPHPRLAERRFVLEPLAEIAENLHVPPPFNRRVADLLEACLDPVAVRKVHPPSRLASLVS